MATTFHIALSDDRLKKLEELARQAGVPADELLRASVEEWLKGPQEDFKQAASYIIKKNAELYRRLA